MIDISKLLSKAGNYKFAPSGAVLDRTLLDIAAQFENDVSRKMTSLTPDQIEKRYTTNESILQTTKYDGEGVFVWWDANEGIFAFNAPSGRVRVGLPALEQLADRLKKQKVQKALFRSELYLPRVDPKQKRPGIADVLRVSFNGTAEEVAGLKLVMLDIIMLDGRDLRPNQEKFQETWDLLGRLFGTDESAPYHRAAGAIIPENELKKIFDQHVAAGEEGLVVRRLMRRDLAKIKPHLSIDAVVIGYVEGEFEGKYGVTSLLTALNYPERENGRLLLQTFSRVGSGFTDKQREELLRAFSTLKVPAPLAMTDSDGRAVHFVKPEHIVELHGEDLASTTGRDKENKTQLLSANCETYDFLGLIPFPRLTFATFHTLRGDKSVSTGGARIEQVLQHPEKPRIRPIENRAPEILRREVFVKGDAVRKLVMVKTASELAAPFVVYWTDYSAKRKEPLKVITQCAFTEPRALALAERLIQENVTKGFAPAGQAAATAELPAPAEKAPEKTRKKKTEESATESKPATEAAAPKPKKLRAKKSPE